MTLDWLLLWRSPPILVGLQHLYAASLLPVSRFWQIPLFKRVARMASCSECPAWIRRRPVPRSQVLQDLLGVRGCVDLRVGLLYLSVRPDEKGDPLGVLRARLLRRSIG